MNIFQKILGTIFPPYKFNVLRREDQRLFDAIVHALPAELSVIKELNVTGRVFGINDHFYPGFKFISRWYSVEEMRTTKGRGLNLKITGLEIYAKRTGNFENLELLVKDGMICGLSISHSAYQLSEFDLEQITSKNMMQSSFEFPPDPIDLFYNSLDQEIKDKLAIEDLEEIDYNNRTFYSFCDLENGNYLAVDKNHKVYSLVHDARPMAKGLKISFIDILNEMANDQFDKEMHLNERYENSK